MRKFPLLLMSLCCGTSLAHAQVQQAYYQNPGYRPAALMPANVPPGYYGYPAAPVQPVQYQYGISPSPSRADSYPRPNYTSGPYGYYNGYGVNYYYARNPMGLSPTPAPYSAVANNRAIGQTTNWPAPVDPSLTEAAVRAPEVPFHRRTNECTWVSVDYLGTFIRPMRLAGPLVTTGSPQDPRAGSLGRPSTAILFGNDPVNFNLLSGARLEAGLFLDQCDRFSIELAGFYLAPGRQMYNIAGDSTGNPVITRPVFRTDNGQEGNFVTSLPGIATGTFNADFRSQMGGAELNFRIHHYGKERFHADCLFGFRYLRLEEQLQVLESIRGILPGFVTFLGAPIAGNESLIDDDLFRTTNQFFGTQVGGRLSWEHDWVTITTFGKVGVGATQQQTLIEGTTTKVSPTGNSIASGGILALPTNIGNHSRTVLGIMPEFGVNVGVDLTQCVRVKLGYSVLLWNHVVRAGNQFDRTINTGQVPGNVDFGKINGPSAPIYRYNEEFFWAQSFNLGVEVHY